MHARTGQLFRCTIRSDRAQFQKNILGGGNFVKIRWATPRPFWRIMEPSSQDSQCQGNGDVLDSTMTYSSLSGILLNVKAPGNETLYGSATDTPRSFETFRRIIAHSTHRFSTLGLRETAGISSSTATLVRYTPSTCMVIQMLIAYNVPNYRQAFFGVAVNDWNPFLESAFAENIARHVLGLTRATFQLKRRKRPKRLHRYP